MRTSSRHRGIRRAQRTALAAALALAFGSAAQATIINVGPRGLAAGPYTLAQAITDENNKYSTGGGDCTTDTIVIAAGFVTRDSAPLPHIGCPGLTIQGATPSRKDPHGSLISGQNSFFYGGCGLEADVPSTLQSLEVTGFTYGFALCGSFNAVTGSYIHGNGAGIQISPGTRAAIGGTKSSERNYIFDNGSTFAQGIFVEYGGAADIVGNYIGTPDGTSAVPNGVGIIIDGATSVTVDSNVITETSTAIMMNGGGSITNNFIGVDASGSGNLGSGNVGVSLSSPDPTVSIAGNTIANMQYAIEALTVTGGQIGGNQIGVTSTGQPLAASGTQGAGIAVFCASGLQLTTNRISGQAYAGVMLGATSSTTLDGNTITGNGGDGVMIIPGCGIGRMPLAAAKRATAPVVALPTATSGNTFSNNTITSNGGYGLDFSYGGMSSNNLVRGNTVANNTLSGVAFLDSTSIDNAIIGNSIFGNAPKNIDLTSGANEGIPSPQIQSVVQNGTTTVVTYQLNNAAATAHDYTVEFFTNPSTGIPAGTTFQRQVYQAGVLGVQTFSETFAGSLDNFSLTSTLSSAPGGWIETSEFSPIVSATRVLPAITFTPVLTDFGTVYVNHQSSTFTITATNGSSGTISGLGAPGVTPPFRILSSDCGSSLASNASCSTSVVFLPSTSGVATGTLSYGNFSASLTGTALDAPILDVAGLIDFGTYILGTPALTRTATLTNTGSAVVTIDGISVDGPFGLSHDCPINLRPGDSCTLTVTFSSSTLGTAAGTVTIRSNALGGARTVALGALVQARPEPVIEVHPDSLTFGNGLIGSTSPSLRVIVSNSGGVAAILGSMTPTDDYVVVSTTCTTSLAPLSSCTVDVALRPIGFGSRPGTLSFTSNADGSPHKVGLGGTGCRPPGASSNRGDTTDLCSP